MGGRSPSLASCFTARPVESVVPTALRATHSLVSLRCWAQCPVSSARQVGWWTSVSIARTGGTWSLSMRRTCRSIATIYGDAPPGARHRSSEVVRIGSMAVVTCSSDSVQVRAYWFRSSGRAVAGWQPSSRACSPCRPSDKRPERARPPIQQMFPDQARRAGARPVRLSHPRCSCRWSTTPTSHQESSDGCHIGHPHPQPDRRPR